MNVKRRPISALGLAIVFVVGVLTIFGPYIASYDPEAMDLTNRLIAPVWMKGGDWQHPFGTDMLGKDILSRMICGTRSSMIIGLTSGFIALTIGVSLGMLSGYLGGMIDVVVMRIVDIMLALPTILLAVVFVATIGPHSISIIIAIGLTMWSEYAKVIRSQILVLKEENFILASRLMGASATRVIIKHMLPNLLYLIIVIFTLQIGLIILWAAGLSFIGLGGVALSWGWDIAAGRSYLGQAWWLSTLPGIALFITVLGFNLFGDLLKDVLHPS
jgi:peptide/nickel transport system permease protein